MRIRRAFARLATPWARGYLAVSLAAGLSCATYSDDLARGQRAFEGGEDERALAIFRVLESDTPRLSEVERARYAYLRGMTDFRMGYKAEARHYLALAASMEQNVPGSLVSDWLKPLADTLKELNEEVYTAGAQALTNVPAAGDSHGDRGSAPAATPPAPPATSPPAQSAPADPEGGNGKADPRPGDAN